MKLSSFHKSLASLILALNVIVAAMAGWWLEHTRGNDRRNALTTVDNLAQVLQVSLSATIRHVDLSLQTVADEYRRQSAAGGIGERAINDFLARQQSRLPEIESLRITDAQGNVRFGLGVTPGTNLADREHFIAGRDDASGQLYIAKPVFARISKKWVLVLSRRLECADGRFCGVVYINLALAHLSDGFRDLRIGPSGAASLRDATLGLIVRVPETLPIEKALGNREVSPALRALVDAGKSAGSYIGRTSYDRIERASAFRRLDPYPLYVTIGLAEDDYLAGWRQAAAITIVALALFALVTLSSSWLLVRAWRRQEAIADELARSELKLRTIIDTEPECVKLLDADCRLLMINSAGLRMIDADGEDQVRGQDVTSLLDVCYREPFRALTKRVFEGGSGMLEFEITGLKGSRRWLETHAAPLRSPAGAIISALGVTRDISRRKRAEALLNRLNNELEQRVAERTAQLEAANKELHEISYSVSHDLRSPLRAIAGFARVLEEDLGPGLGAEGRRLVHVIEEAGLRMGHLIDGLLDYLELSRRPLRLGTVDVTALATEIFAAMAPADGSAVFDVAAGPPARGDPEIMREVLQKLLSNALKFTAPKPGAAISVGGFAGESDNTYFVRDNGIGFDAQFADKLFRVFERLHTEPGLSGMGIGLAMVKRAVERQGGRVWAEGKVGEGATFYFSLPKAAG